MKCVYCDGPLAASEISLGFHNACAVDENGQIKRRDSTQVELNTQNRMEIEKIPLTTTNSFSNHETHEEMQIVTAECVFGMNIFRDMFAGIRDIVGGRSDASQKVLRDLRDACLTELKQEAFDIGADGIVGVRLDYQEMSGGGKGMLFLVASGTAVKFKK
ncbi:YbjQ family protein [Gammaproteobacteria bacterium]|nr:YbjQ family protein [Gammaproteobacteria bacterium]MDC1415174.1 YbjQ family protein [Gammaproteobacteria bacterium]